MQLGHGHTTISLISICKQYCSTRASCADPCPQALLSEKIVEPSDCYGGPQVQTQQHIFSKHNKQFSEHNTILSKHNTTLSKHNTILSKHNTIFGKHNTKYSRNLCRIYAIIQRINASLLNRWHFMRLAKSHHFWWPFCFRKMFCANCGTGLKSLSKFCHSCGEKVELDTVSACETDKGATKCLSFKDFAARKSDERSTHFRSSGSKKKGQKRKDADPFALMKSMWA